MAEKPAVKDALARLDRALASLESAVEKRRAKELSVGALQSDLQRMSKERSELTQTLDLTKARSDRLESANEEVSRRLGAAASDAQYIDDLH